MAKVNVSVLMLKGCDLVPLRHVSVGHIRKGFCSMLLSTADASLVAAETCENINPHHGVHLPCIWML